MKQTVVLLFKTQVNQPDELAAIDEALGKFHTLQKIVAIDNLLQKGVSFPSFPHIEIYPVEREIKETARSIDAALKALGFELRATHYYGDRNSQELWYDGDDGIRVYVTIERER